MVIIATDSAADFEMHELEKMNITYMPMTVSFGDDTYLENIELLRIKFDDDQSKYIYTSNYCNIINLLLDNEETIFKNLLIEIDKLPKWMHNDLINLKSQQLNNNHRKELIK